MKPWMILTALAVLLLAAGIWLVLKLPAKYVQPHRDKAERLIEQIKAETEDVQK